MARGVNDLNNGVVAASDVVFFAVKPQYAKATLESVAAKARGGGGGGGGGGSARPPNTVSTALPPIRLRARVFVAV